MEPTNFSFSFINGLEGHHHLDFAGQASIISGSASARRLYEPIIHHIDRIAREPTIRYTSFLEV